MRAVQKYLEMVVSGYFAIDGEAQDETLEDHDKRHHGGHYDPKTMSCGKRDEMEKKDKADEGVAKSNSGTKEESGKGKFLDADGKPISMKVNEEWRHSYAKPRWINRPTIEDVGRIKETDLNRKMPSLGIQSSISLFADSIAPINGHYVVIPSSGSLWIHRNKGDENVRVERDERDLDFFGKYHDGMTTPVYNDSLKAIKKLSDDGMFMQSFKCDYSEDERGFGRLVFSRKKGAASDDGEAQDEGAVE